MYSIGAFSKMNRVTVKTLHHYDKEGLLKPAYVDQVTGYRYYASTQISTLHQIMAMKQMGFSIAEMKESVENKDPAELIRLRKQEILAEITSLTNQLAQADYYLTQEQIPDIYIKSLPSVIVASMRMTISSQQDLFTVFPTMGEKMMTAGCKLDPIEYCFQMFHDPEYRDHNIDVELCEAVTKQLPDQNGLVFKELPEVPLAACLIHRGPYEKIRHAHAALHEWLAHNPYELYGPPREAAIDGIWNKINTQDWLTEVQFPLKYSV